MLFDESPVAIWLEDFSEVYRCLNDLKATGVNDIRAYFCTYPQKLAECISLLKVVDVNKSTLQLYKAKSLNHLLENMHLIFKEDTQPTLMESILAISDGKRSFESMGINYDLEGKRLIFRITWSMPDDDPGDYSNVIVAIQDMTRLEKIRAELEERETLFRCVFEQASEGMMLVNPQGVAVLANKAMTTLTGIPALEMVGSHIWDIHQRFCESIKILGESKITREDVMQALIDAEDIGFSSEYRFTDSRRKLHAHRQSLVRIKNVSEPLYAIILTDQSHVFRSEMITRTMHDISHAVNTTESLDDLFCMIHKALGSLVDVTNFYIAFYDDKSNLITFPYLVDEMNEDPSPVEADDEKSLTVQVIREAKTLLLEEEAIRERTGRSLLLGIQSKNWLGVPLIVNSKVIGAMVLQSYKDPHLYDNEDKLLLESVSEQIAFALQKKKSDENLNVLIQAIEQAGEGIVIFSPEGFIRYVNTVFEKTTGYKRIELFDKPVEYLPFDQNSRIDMQQSWLRVRSSQPWRGKIDMIRKDGAKITLDMVVKPVVDAENRLSSIIASCKDVTFEIMREEQLKRTQRLEAIGRLTGGIAHDFNNVLSAIIGYAELAGDDVPRGSECAQNLQEVLKGASRAKDMISHLISFSRQEESKTELVELVEHVRESVRLLRSYIPRSIKIKETYTATDSTVIAVPGQIHQILINLGTNSWHAIKHDNGIIEVRVEQVSFRSKDMLAFPELEQCRYLKISVSDNGSGIDDALVDHIFDPYFTTKSANEGTGLGLSTVHSIVNAHHGAIRVKSEIDKGTCFEIYLPLYIADQWQAGLTELAPYTDVAGTENIMFIDDEPMLVNIFRQGLMKLGYKVEGFTDPRKALEYFSRHHHQIDLVVTDTTMPFMNGIDLSEKLLRTKPTIPIIVCSGFTTLISAEEVVQKGIKDFVMKPYKIKEIAAKIREHL